MNSMKTNTINSGKNSNVASSTIASASRQALTKYKMLLCLAALAVSCASGYSQTVVNYGRAAAEEPTSEQVRQSENNLIGNEIYNMLMADKSFNLNIKATVN